ncbi:hypothetical protein [Iamia sp.]|uniref:hypothetical protein n=1 Tax=Iamia sp. TaxID=2722710 RepID=UPI002C92FC20|nr:hypothetical protein [Iamia sp.]HXH56599.1 hypothetical protein [Iamia sp.]
MTNVTTLSTSADYGTFAFWSGIAPTLKDRTLVCDAMGFRHLVATSDDADNRVRAYLAELVSREAAYQAGDTSVRYHSSRADCIAFLTAEGIAIEPAPVPTKTHAVVETFNDCTIVTMAGTEAACRAEIDWCEDYTRRHGTSSRTRTVATVEEAGVVGCPHCPAGFAKVEHVHCRTCAGEVNTDEAAMTAYAAARDRMRIAQAQEEYKAAEYGREWDVLLDGDDIDPRWLPDGSDC